MLRITGSVTFRFLRLVVVVPVMEEIFWRAFLLRFVIDENFEQVQFGNLAGFLLRSWLWDSLLVIPAQTGSRRLSAACSKTVWPTAAAAWLCALLPTLDQSAPGIVDHTDRHSGFW